MPVRRGTRLGPSRPLTMAEVKEIAADVTATTSWGDWVTAVQRYQHGVCLWDVRTDAVVPMRQVGDMRRSVGACPMLTFSTTYDLNNKMVMLNAFCTAMAKGMRLLSADEACHLLMGKGSDDASAIAAQESVTLLTAMLDGSMSTFAKELYGAPPREALALGKLDQAAELYKAMTQFCDAAHTDQWTEAVRNDGTVAVGFEASSCLLHVWALLTQLLECFPQLEEAEARLMRLLSTPKMCALALSQLQGTGELSTNFFKQLLLRSTLLKRPPTSLEEQKLLQSPQLHRFVATGFAVLAHEATRQRRDITLAWAVHPPAQEKQQKQQRQRQRQQQQQQQRSSSTRAGAASNTSGATGSNTKFDAAKAAAKASGRLIQPPCCASAALKPLLALGCSTRTTAELQASLLQWQPFSSILRDTAGALLELWPLIVSSQGINSSSNSTGTCTNTSNSSSSSSSSSNMATGPQPSPRIRVEHFMTRDDAHWLTYVCAQAAQAALVGDVHHRGTMVHYIMRMLVALSISPLNSPMAEASCPAAEQQQQQRAPAGNSSGGVQRWCSKPPPHSDVVAAVMLSIGPAVVDVVSECISMDNKDLHTDAKTMMKMFAPVVLNLYVHHELSPHKEMMIDHLYELSRVLASAPLTVSRTLELVLRSVVPQGFACRGYAGPQQADNIRRFGYSVASCMKIAAKENDVFRGCVASVESSGVLLPQLACLLLTVLKVLRLAPTGAPAGDQDSGCRHAVLGAVHAAAAAAALMQIVQGSGAPAGGDSPLDPSGTTRTLLLLVAMQGLLLVGDLLKSRHGGTQIVELYSTVEGCISEFMLDVLLCMGGDACLLPALQRRGAVDSSSSSKISDGVASIHADFDNATGAMSFAVVDVRNDKTSTKAAQQLGEKLVPFAQLALALLPSPLCCNNPACVNLEETAEWQLVSRRGSVCAGCRTARYCCTACQRAHWAMHKPVCKALKEALADGGYVSPSGYIGVSRVVKL